MNHTTKRIDMTIALIWIVALILSLAIWGLIADLISRWTAHQVFEAFRSAVIIGGGLLLVALIALAWAALIHSHGNGGYLDTLVEPGEPQPNPTRIQGPRGVR